MKKTSLDAAWTKWIAENKARGCTPESMVELMVQNGFDAGFAWSSVTGEVPAGLPQVAGAYVPDAPRVPPGRALRASDCEARILTRQEKPFIVTFADVLSAQECDELVALAKPRLERSTVVDPAAGTAVPIKDRSSEGAFLNEAVDPLLARINRRLAELFGIPAEQGEDLHILRYGLTGEYKPHFDYFPAEQAGSQAHLRRGGQRMATLIVYLNDVGAGGETIFPEVSLSVLPIKGNAVYFEYTNARGQVDPLTLHGGAPVTGGEKWIVTKWWRQGRFQAAQ